METITISKSHYNRLLKDQKFLRNLEAAGVDNWEAYNAFEDDDPKELPTP